MGRLDTRLRRIEGEAARAVRTHVVTGHSDDEHQAKIEALSRSGVAALQQCAEPGQPGGSEHGPELFGGKGCRALEGLERHVPGKPLGHDHVDLAGQQVRAFYVPGEVDLGAAVRRLRGRCRKCR